MSYVLTPEQKNNLAELLTQHIQEQAAALAEKALNDLTTPPKTIYISGPMSGIEEAVMASTFYTAEAIFQDMGFRTINPKRMDDEAPIEGVSYPKPGEAPSLALRQTAFRDAKAILLEADAIAFLKGWSFSRGALAESHLARWLGLPAYFQRVDGSWEWRVGGSW